MDIAHSIPSTVSSISFSFLTSEDIRRISVKQIVNPVLLDDLNRPNLGGLYDPALGPSTQRDICATCRLTYFQCPGHFGHIELPAPVYHPLFMINMYNLLRGACLYCHKFKIAPALHKYIAKLRLLEHGLLDAANTLDDIHIRGEKSTGGDEEEKEGEERQESTEEFEQRINLFVHAHLYRASGSKRDDYKDGIVYQTRKEVITEFLKATIAKKCSNCGAFAHSFRKEGYTKIIEYELTPKQKGLHEASQITRPNVLRVGKPIASQSNSHGNSDSDSDVDMDDAGEPAMSDEDESDRDNGKEHTHQIARAANGAVKGVRGRNERVMAPEECRAHLRRLFANDAATCALLYGQHGPFAKVSSQGIALASADMFFMDVVPVAPTRFRPPAKLGETLFEHPQNELLAKVLNTSFRIRDLNNELRAASAKDAYEQEALATVDRLKITSLLLEALVQLQIDVNSFMDSSKNPAPVRQGKLPPAGVKQGLEKKEGLFRKHMMGKRVNYAARSVISPDVNIETNEIGIPPVFARKLTFPEPVTPMNIHEMRQLVINGDKEYPGATMVQFEDGSQQHLDKLTVEQRTAVANQLLTPQEGNRAASSTQGLATRTLAVNKKVYRHLRDGDMLILNRQPTLHKPSMMAHKARVLQGEKTIRMHYANCNSYNADFDGDEMNIHFPQNQIPRAEATSIANTDNQYLVPTSGDPLRGLIQDHVVAGVWMTNKSTFFTREEYQQLLYGALRPEDDYTGGGRVITLPPAMWKPKPLWTGKQIISTVLANITPDNAQGLHLTSKAKVKNEFWGKHSTEQDVIVYDGHLICGVLDKSQFGASPYGLVHAVYEIYGAEIAGKLLSILSRLFTKYLQHRAFTCRMDDLCLTPEGDRMRREVLDQAKNYGTEAAVENFPSLADPTLSDEERTAALRDRLEEILRDDNKMAGLDVTVKSKMRTIPGRLEKACIPHGLFRKFPDNHMQTMTMTGAKGTAVNARQISCLLGQQELEGRRVPVMVSGKTLPAFKAFETAAIAGGFIASRFFTGLRPQEFYFHCMAGREGLIDTAVKTSRSGYLQRCLIKHLEGIRIHYDNTVRGSDSSIYQFHYGGDALDITKQKYLLGSTEGVQKQLFDFSILNSDSLMHRCRLKDIAGVINDEDAPAYMKKALKKLDHAQRRGGEDRSKPPIAPALSLYSPSTHIGATSERFARAVDDYIKSPNSLIKPKKSEVDHSKPHRKDLMPQNKFKALMNVRYLRSLVEPGEAVGLLASQGVGEPSTQMTLNTFHFAGHGAANVTLGIPRLREIVMTASIKPKTPTMTLPVKPEVTVDEINTFCKSASRLTLSEIVDTVTVKERLTAREGIRTRNFTIKIEFFPPDQYKEECGVGPMEVLGPVGTTFAGIIRREINRELKKLDADLKGQAANIGKGRAVRENARAAGGDEDADDDADGGPATRANDADSEIGDGDADDAKRARQSKQQATYDDDDDEEEEDDDGQEFTAEGIEAAFQDSDAEAGAETADKVANEPMHRGSSLKGLIAAAEQSFVSLCTYATSFTFRKNGSGCEFDMEFGADTPKLLLVGIIERCCSKTVIHEIPRISRCLRVAKDSPDDPESMMTEGSNFYGIWDTAGDLINVNSIYSNDIYAILCTYGVEMARCVILQEIQSVFKAYNIGVDPRHVELIADYMTFDGGYKPFNRKGISTNSSPLLKASYETTAAFLSDATLHGDFDDLTSPSGNIVMGRPSMCGTGAFDIVTRTASDIVISA
ncbi:hypothetical protein BOTBODRAFT_554491 [Botryobasidium botryosum FD-172 SS1]|uniref:DNA-directed RNA polymerase subunit n=1 Tax=Botryobasidium botryosum (strain FD-172 SS1) TaxID=930990 RepID=A0A067N3B1_BOTB1|nr:hypothetical protein BOTBODRAFT_554491 [Botryobasidium botryosum FD-172 SS1]